MKKIITSVCGYKYLYAIGFLNFVILYASVFTPGYGYFIDEFYYIACANNPALGYVDHPPLAPLILTGFQFLFGNSVYALRLLPATAASATVITTGFIAKELGGNKPVQVLSAFCILASPVYAAFAGFYSMNAFEPLISSLVFYFIILMIKENKPRTWIIIGILFGIALMNKHTAGIYIALLIIVLILLPERKYLFTKWFIFCLIISFIIFFPNVLWQINNDFPSLEFYRNISSDKNVPVSPLQFILNQALFYSPFLVPFWVVGTLIFIFGKDFRQFRMFGLLFLAAFLFFMFTKTSRPDRLAFAYPAVIPAGVIFFDNLFIKYKIRWVYGPVYTLLTFWFVISIPLLVPYLSYEKTEQLTNLLGMNTELEKGKKPRIPQLLSDRIGWEEKTEMMAKVLWSIPESERSKVMISGTNYGNAGAFELFGIKYNFPPVVSSHNNYFLWSKNRLNGDILLQLAHKNSYKDYKELFENVDSTDAFFNNEYCSPHEQNLTVFICKKPKIPLLEMLEGSKNYY